MLNKQKHQLIMGQILKDITSDTTLSPLLGLKGGTCAFFFYDLPRFSVDLDFDLLEKRLSEKAIITKLKTILESYGKIEELIIKQNTIFSLLSYGHGDRNIKIEINTRLADSKKMREFFSLQKYLSIPVLSASKEYLLTSKLVALLGRRSIAMRDVFDIHFFTKNTWPLDTHFLEKQTSKKTKIYLDACIKTIEQIPETSLLVGLGEYIDEKQKYWVKHHLKQDTIFLLKGYQKVVS